MTEPRLSDSEEPSEQELFIPKANSPDEQHKEGDFISPSTSPSWSTVRRAVDVSAGVFLGVMVGVLLMYQQGMSLQLAVGVEFLLRSLLSLIGPSSSSNEMTSRSFSHRLLPQDRVAVCLHFDEAPSFPALDLLLQYHSQLHSSLVLLSPALHSDLSRDLQELLRHYPSVPYVAVPRENHGLCQHFSLAACLDHWNQSEVVRDYDGVLYLSDDTWFDWREVLYPRCRSPELEGHQGVYTSFTSRDVGEMRLQFPFDEFWYSEPRRMMNMRDERETLDEWWFWSSGVWPPFRLMYWAMPQQWRDWLSEISGRMHYVLATGSADAIYVPFHHSQLSHLLTVLHTVNEFNLTFLDGSPGCVTAEAHVGVLVHIAMMMSGRPPLVMIPEKGAHEDPRMNRAFSRNSTVFYADTVAFLENLHFSRQHGQANSSVGWQLRPVPFRSEGFNLPQDDLSSWRWITRESNGDPVLAQPMRLNDNETWTYELYREAYSQLIQDLRLWDPTYSRCKGTII